MPLVTADDLCRAAEAILVEYLPDLAESRGLKPFTKWDQLPTPEALTAANLPAGAITSPGLTDRPTHRAAGFDATWQVVVGVYDRGRDYHETARLVRTWAAVVRQTLLQHPTLGGVASGLQWVGEQYAETPDRSASRTLGGCAVAFAVTARNVIDAERYVPPDPGAPGTPIVQSTATSVSVR